MVGGLQPSNDVKRKVFFKAPIKNALVSRFYELVFLLSHRKLLYNHP